MGGQQFLVGMQRGQVQVVVDAAVAAESTARAAAIAGAAFPMPKPKVGQRFSHMHAYGGNASTQIIPGSGNIYAGPMAVLRAMPISAMEIEVSTAGAAGVSIRMALMSMDGDGSTWAATLIAESAAIAADVIGVKTHTLTYTLQPGIVYLACVISDGTPTIRTVINSRELFGQGTAAGAAAPRNGLQVSQAYGAYPATKTFTATANFLPLIHFTVA